MAIVKEILTDALIEVGILDPTLPIQADMANHALRTLNRMLDSFSVEDLMVYTENRDVYPLQIGVQRYEMGPASDPQLDPPITLSTTRPSNITRLSVLLTQSGPLPPEITIPILNTQEWQAVVVKNTVGGFPTSCYITGDFPTQNLYMWPIPQVQCSLVVYTWGILSRFDSISDVVNFPKGYEEALMYNLAVRIASAYGRQASPTTVEMARQGKARLRELNTENIYIGADSGLLGNNTGIAVASFGMVVDR